MKKTAAFLLILGQIFVGVPIPSAQAAIFLPITAPSAILMDYSTNQILYSKTPNLKRAPASTTKILTSLVVMDTLSLDQVVTIPDFVNSIEPSKAHLQPGERYRVQDLLRATLISSANDAAETLAYHAGNGSRQIFANKMNAKVRALGGQNSHFVRASGLPAVDQYSTAYDMALVMREAQRNPFIVETMKIKTMMIRSMDGRPICLKNHNKMLWRSGRSVLGKTGWTQSARHCFVGIIHVAGRDVFVSMMGSRKIWKDLTRMRDFLRGGSAASKIASKKSRPNGKAVAIKAQKALKELGFYSGPFHGIMDSKSRKAIRKFQKSKKIRATGRLGPKTLQALQPYF